MVTNTVLTKTPGRLPTAGHLSARCCLHLFRTQPGAGPASSFIHGVTWLPEMAQQGQRQRSHLLAERHDSSYRLPVSEEIHPQFRIPVGPATESRAFTQLSFPRVLHTFPSATRNVTLGFTHHMREKIKTTCPRDLSWAKMMKLTVKKSPILFFRLSRIEQKKMDNPPAFLKFKKKGPIVSSSWVCSEWEIAGVAGRVT